MGQAMLHDPTSPTFSNNWKNAKKKIMMVVKIDSLDPNTLFQDAEKLKADPNALKLYSLGNVMRIYR